MSVHVISKHPRDKIFPFFIGCDIYVYWYTVLISGYCSFKIIFWCRKGLTFIYHYCFIINCCMIVWLNVCKLDLIAEINQTQ